MSTLSCVHVYNAYTYMYNMQCSIMYISYVVTYYTNMCVVSEDGSICAKKANPAVTKELLLEIQAWKNEGAVDADIITRLRQRTVPNMYQHHTWTPVKLYIHENSHRKLNSRGLSK